MHLLVVGSEGSIGKRRKMLLEEMGNKVTGIDVKRGEYLTQSIAKQYDAIFICLPPNQCVTTAIECASAKVPYFLEKPGAVNHREFISLMANMKNLDLTTMVACNLRFTPEYRAIQEALPNIGKPLFTYAEFGYFLPFWREGQYRTYYSCYRMAGGGIMMDSIHEFDYMFSLFGFPKDYRICVSTNESTGELPDLDAEDNVNFFMCYKSGLGMTIHLDYLQRAYKRVFFAIGTKGRIDQTFNVQGSNAMYKAEMNHFLDCVKHGKDTIKPVEQHFNLLEFLDKLKDNAHV